MSNHKNIQTFAKFLIASLTSQKESCGDHDKNIYEMITKLQSSINESSVAINKLENDLALEYSERIEFARRILSGLRTRSKTMLTLAKQSVSKDEEDQNWDSSSACTLARSMMDSRLTFYYLCTQVCKKFEWEVKKLSLQILGISNDVWIMQFKHPNALDIELNPYFNRFAMILEGAIWQNNNTQDHVETPKDPKEKFKIIEDFFKGQAFEQISRLANNPYYQSLEPNIQNNIKNGKMQFIHSIEVIAEESGITRAKYKEYQRNWSQYVHAYPMNGAFFSREANGKACDSESKILLECLTFTEQSLANSSMEALALKDTIRSEIESHATQ